jgi:hypothetical protein
LSRDLAGDLGPPDDFAVWVQFPPDATEPGTIAFHGWELVRLEFPVVAGPAAPSARATWASRLEVVLYVTTETEREFVATVEMFNVRTAKRQVGAALAGAQGANWKECVQQCTAWAARRGFLADDGPAVIARLLGPVVGEP